MDESQRLIAATTPSSASPGREDADLQARVHQQLVARANARQTLTCCCWTCGRSRLGWSAWLFVGSHVVTLAFLVVYAPVLAAATLLVLVPTLGLVCFTRYGIRHANANDTTGVYAVGFVPVVLVAVALSTMLRLLFNFVFLGEWAAQPFTFMPLPDAEHRVPEWWRPLGVSYVQLWYLSRVWICLVAAALVEEGLKCILLVQIRRRLAVTDGCLLVFYAVAAAVGFATAENLTHVHDAVQRSGLIDGLVLGAARIAMPLNVVTMLYLACGVCRRVLFADAVWSWPWILLPPVVWHGVYDFCLVLAAHMWSAAWFGGAVAVFLAATVASAWQLSRLQRAIRNVGIEPV